MRQHLGQVGDQGVVLRQWISHLRKNVERRRHVADDSRRISFNDA
jgi:hypothetical protein